MLYARACSLKIISVFHLLSWLRGNVAEHELLLVLLKELHRSLHIDEETVHFADVLNVDFGGLALLGNQVGRCDQVDAVTEGALLRDLS